MDMPNGLDAKEIGAALGILPRTAKKRLERKGIKPISYSGPTAIYDPAVVDDIRETPSPGRPRKAPEPEAKEKKAKK